MNILVSTYFDACLPFDEYLTEKKPIRRLMNIAVIWTVGKLVSSSQWRSNTAQMKMVLCPAQCGCVRFWTTSLSGKIKDFNVILSTEIKEIPSIISQFYLTVASVCKSEITRVITGVFFDQKGAKLEKNNI